MPERAYAKPTLPEPRRVNEKGQPEGWPEWDQSGLEAVAEIHADTRDLIADLDV